MKNILLLLILFPLSFTLKAQTESKEEIISSDQVSEMMPQFPGGQDALNKYLYDKVLKKNEEKIRFIYDTLKRPRKVYAEFMVTETGKITDVCLQMGSGSSYIDSLNINALKNMPDWMPGIFKGEKKSIRMYLPISIEFK